jgi:hypothetical protein
MMVLSNICKKCNYTCNAIHFQQNFENWTSGNDDIDKFIQDTQLSSHNDVKETLEWITYNRFYDIKYIEKIGLYEANWVGGYIVKWDNEDQNWKRVNKHIFVALKNLNNPKNAALEFTNEV